MKKKIKKNPPPFCEFCNTLFPIGTNFQGEKSCPYCERYLEREKAKLIEVLPDGSQRWELLEKKSYKNELLLTENEAVSNIEKGVGYLLKTSGGWKFEKI